MPVILAVALLVVLVIFIIFGVIGLGLGIYFSTKIKTPKKNWALRYFLKLLVVIGTIIVALLIAWAILAIISAAG